MQQGNWITIEVVNWEKYNPRNDRKNYTWFRLENSIVTEPKFFGLSAAEKFIAVCLLAEAAKDGGSAKIHLPWLADQLRVKREEILHTIAVLVSNGVLKTPEDTTRHQLPPTKLESNIQGTLRTDVRTRRDETDEETKGETAVAVRPPEESSKELAKKKQTEKAATFIGAYVKAYQGKFPEGRPEDLHDPKVRGQILAWIKDYPIDRATALIQVYFQMDTKWFGVKGYDFLTFRNNLNKIGQALDSGKDPDGNQIDWSRVRMEVGA